MISFRRNYSKLELPGWLNIPKSISRRWFQIFYMFTSIWGGFPSWLICFRWVEATSKKSIFLDTEPHERSLDPVGAFVFALPGRGWTEAFLGRWIFLATFTKFYGDAPSYFKKCWIDRLEDVTWISKVTYPPKKKKHYGHLRMRCWKGAFHLNVFSFQGFRRVGMYGDVVIHQMMAVKWCKLSLKANAHRIHVWYNYLYNPLEFTLNKNQM